MLEGHQRRTSEGVIVHGKALDVTIEFQRYCFQHQFDLVHGSNTTDLEIHIDFVRTQRPRSLPITLVMTHV